MIKPSCLLSSSILVALAGLATPVAAQDSPDAPQIADATDAGEIIVTARRRDETAQQTPVAITVLNEALLDRYGVKGVNSIAQLTPGMFTGEASGSVGGSISLRGIGSGDSQPFIDQAISLNVDGVPISTAQLLRAAQLDLKQIEVLRGPQALFFGKNSPGGIISLISADPTPTFEAMVRGGYEFVAQEKYAEATVSGPLGDTLGARLAGRYSRQNGYIDIDSPPTAPYLPSTLEHFPNQEEVFVRGTLAWTPSDRIKVRIKGTHTSTQIKGGPSFFSDVTACPYETAQGAVDLPSNCFNDGRILTAQLPAGFLQLDPFMGTNPMGFRNNKQTLFTGTIDVDLAQNITLTSITGYYGIREKLASNGGYGISSSNGFDVLFESDQFTQELRLRSNWDRPVNFVFAGFYESRKLFTRTFIGVPVSGPPSTTDPYTVYPIESTTQKQRSASVFGQLLWRPTEQWELTLGGRFTHEVKKLLDYTVIAGGVATDVTKLPAYPGSPRPELSFNNFSPEITVSYRPHPDMMLFASYKRGFKSGGFDAGYTGSAILYNPARNQVFKPEKVQGGEIGLKSTLADRQLTLNLTGYWYDYSDLQVAVFDTTARAFTTQNAAKAQIRGIELETRLRPHGVPGLNLHLAAAYNDAKFTEYLGGCYRGQTVALGCDQVLNSSTNAYTSQDLAGRQLRKAPRFTVNAGGYYEFPLSDALMMSLSGDLAYSSGYDAGTAYQPLAYQPAFAKVDATLRLFSENRRWELAVIGRNLTNVRNLIAGIDRTGTGTAGTTGTDTPMCTSTTDTNCSKLSDILGTPMQPRSVAVQVTFRY